MNRRLLFFKRVINHSDGLSIIISILILLYVCFLGHEKKVHLIVISILASVMFFLDYISSIKLYRYSYNRKMDYVVTRGLGLAHCSIVLAISLLFFLPIGIRISMILFFCGLLFIKTSCEIKRAKSFGFEHCGNWQIRRVLGISLMVLPLLFYALVFLSSLLYN